MRQSLSLTALLLTFATTTIAGTAIVKNNCGSTVYFASIKQSVHAAFQPLPAGGYSESYNLDNVGISIKLSPNANGAPVTQFEYTWTKGDKMVAYDISNIDGNPFAMQGMSLAPSIATPGAFPSCVTVDCPAGQDYCDAAYNLPDDVRTKVCPDNADLIFTLCPGGGSAAPPSNSTAPPASSAADSDDTPAPSTSAVQQPSQAPTKATTPAASPTAAATSTGWTRTRTRGGHQRRRGHYQHFD